MTLASTGSDVPSASRSLEPLASASGNRRKAVFLDRDGVLIESFLRDGVPHPPDDLEQVRVLPGVARALCDLRNEGYLLLVVTNQPDVARGTQTVERVERINDHLAHALPLDGVYVCYHDAPDRCDCRKPAPGMLLRAAQDHGVDLAASFLVGDRWSDVAAGAAAGCRTLLVDRPYSHGHRCSPDAAVADLREAARRILALSPAARE